MSKTQRFWLLKTEPAVYSIDDLAREKKRTTCWDGVRNYQARNYMRDEMKLGDRVLLYHSNADPPGIAGVAQIVRESYPDHTSWDPSDKHFDPKSSPQQPRWFMVDVQLERKFAELIPLTALRENRSLKEMVLLQRGSRLSVQPVSERQFDAVLKMAAQQTPAD